MRETRRLTDSERVAWTRLARAPGIGPVTFAQLLDRFRTPEAALASLPELARRAGAKQTMALPAQTSIEQEILTTRSFGAEILASCEPEFPILLRALVPPPPVVTMLGRAPMAAGRTVAIVGARNASAAGRKIARDMARTIGEAGWVTVSGLALGIDGEVHAASLATGTIAVLAGGINQIYPPQHDRLYAEIAARGLLISESPFGHQAKAQDFPRRNRIITGLSRGVVIVEAAERSGSLISARTAGEQGREVMAVPGSPLDPRAAGTNALIRDGATLVRHAEDVLQALSELPPLQQVRSLTQDRFESDPLDGAPPADQVQSVAGALTAAPLPIDEIARGTGLSVARCRSILVELELAGRAMTYPGGLAAMAVD